MGRLALPFTDVSPSYAQGYEAATVTRQRIMIIMVDH